MSLHENTFNVLLSEELKRTSARWRENNLVIPEAQGILAHGRGRPDIHIKDTGPNPIVIESAYGGDRDEDAKKRLLDGDYKTAITVAIPDVFKSLSAKEEILKKLRERNALSYAVLQIEDGVINRFPIAGYLQGAAKDLASFIQKVAVPKSAIEDVAGRVATKVEFASDALMSGITETECKKIIARVHQHTKLPSFRTVAVLWLDAMLVQSHLQIREAEGISASASRMDHRPSLYIEAWRRILEENWYSIFEPAIDVLDEIAQRSTPSTVTALILLKEAVELIEAAKIGEYTNIPAELFPKISTDRKTAAAFYTMPATAEFLANLLIGENDHNWDSPALFKKLKVADFACGTGSLVRATYHRIKDLCEAEGMDPHGLSRLHGDAMEKGLTATDISPIAAHFTNSSMALIGGKEAYGKTNIGWVSVGKEGGNSGIKGLTTGALEFLKANEIKDLFSSLTGSERGRATAASSSSNETISAPEKSFDYIIMNPPYSRTRGGQSAFDVVGLTEEQRKSCQSRWGKLLANEPAIKTAGMAPSFLCVAEKKIKEGGRIGFVLPLTAAFQKSWEKTRAMLIRCFKDIAVVSKAGMKGGDDALSADTNLAEMLFIGTRLSLLEERSRGNGKNISPTEVKCITLRRTPVNQGEASEYARSVQKALDTMHGDNKPIFVGKEELGQITTFRPKVGEPWSFLGVLHPELAYNSQQIKEGSLRDMQKGNHIPVTCPMTTLENLFEVGPTHDLIGHLMDKDRRGAFTLTPISRKVEAEGEHVALWEANAGDQSRLLVLPTHKASLWNEEIRKRIASKKSTLHYARGMQWTSQSVLAGTTVQKVFGGSAWTSLLHEDERVRKAFALWANSTLGMIIHWTQGGRTQEGRARTQVKAIHAMPCPDLAKLSDKALGGAVEAFKEFSTLDLLPACQAHTDATRGRIDEAVVAMLGLPREQALVSIRTMQKWWCAEPSVHGYNKKALELLKEEGISM